MPVHAHLERVPVRTRRLQELAVREPDELLQMLRLRGVVRKGHTGSHEEEGCNEREERLEHVRVE